MRLKTRTWALLSLLCFLGAGWFWHLGNQRLKSQPQSAPDPAATNALSHSAPLKELGALNYAHSTPLLSKLDRPATATQTNVKPASAKSLLAWRLSNSTKSIDELMRSEQALLLRNALIDTRAEVGLSIPKHLRSNGDPGSYLVQSRELLTDAFRAQLEAAGARIISYIPNNAYLVRLSQAGAEQMRGLPQTQSVLAWEPYYKLDLPLLPLAVQNKPLPDGTRLSLLFFPGERASGLAALQTLGAAVLGEDRSPFGHVVIVQAPTDSLVPLARLPVVQEIEIYQPRQLANDLSRRRTGVVTDTLAATNNHLDLSGAGVTVNISDSGVDAMHPDLTGRVTTDPNAIPNALMDFDGHGTHVAGTIAGSGANSPAGTNALPGSVSGASFRGMAPAAKLFSLPIDLVTGPFISDSFLQETTARTNILISNNSWNYIGQFDYNLSAASFDAAVRDALPGNIGSQPLLFVFSADNSGGGGSQGQGGVPDSIASPGTAKNVITVGAIENLRNITNTAVTAGGQTNQAFLGDTDSNDQVADFSSRGNVGIGLEGAAGRFKPDVVAPGTFIISCRKSQWEDPTSAVTPDINRIPAQAVGPGESNLYNIFVPNNAIRLGIRTLPNLRSPSPFPNLSIDAAKDPLPRVLQGYGQAFFPVDSGNWFYAIGNTNNETVNYDLQTILFLTNNAGTYFTVLSNLNNQLKPHYRYESGTSMSAGTVSGILALMQEMFEQRLGRTNSPALMKALLINGARSVGTLYNLHTQTDINYQGWGVVNLTNSVPLALNDGPSTSNDWPIVAFEQDPTTALATGESHTRTLKLKTNALIYPLRVTLVWTDPPGNPAASLKLVNDLDLIVSNRLTGEIYIGNNIPQGSDFNDPTDPAETNAPAPFDLVNNVENVFINGPLATTTTNGYDIIVRARRVNVNAVTAHPNGIVQDYALVVSSGNSRLTKAFDLATFPSVVSASEPFTYLKVLTNGQPALNERVGASSPLLVAPNGATNQWNFYKFVNSGITNTNVAFATFLAPNLSRPRQREADIDLYVSTDERLTNLNATAVAAADKSLLRGGTELIIYANALPGLTYYVGVKSEDQQAANFGLLAVATSTPFGARDTNGNIQLQFIPAGVEVPDGSPQAPQAGVMLAIVADPAIVRRLTLEGSITHERGGDLLGNLDHGERFAVLNNHSDFSGTVAFIYDDSGEDDITGSEPTDGPGSLRDFTGESAYGLWRLTMVDDAPHHIGTVDSLIGLIEPQDDLTNPDGILLTIAPGRWRYLSVDVPAGATRLTVCVSANTAPVELFIRRGDFPTMTTYDKTLMVTPPGGCLSVTPLDSPPLAPGRYFIGVFNSSATVQNIRVLATIDQSRESIASTVSSSVGPVSLVDDAVTSVYLTNDQRLLISSLDVGLLIKHPRVSDLAVHLVSPSGTRILLFEDRGMTTTNGLGTFGFTNGASGPIPFTFTNLVPFYTNDFDPGPIGLYAPGAVFQGWNVLTNLVTVYPDYSDCCRSNNVLVLGDGMVLNNLPTTNSTAYQLSFKVTHAPYLVGTVGWWPFDEDGTDIFGGLDGILDGNVVFSIGQVNEAFYGDGVATRMMVPRCPDLDLGQRRGFSIEGWIRPVNVTNAAPLVEWNDPTNQFPLGVQFWLATQFLTNGGPGSLAAVIWDTDSQPHRIEAGPFALTNASGCSISLNDGSVTKLEVIARDRNGNPNLTNTFNDLFPTSLPFDGGHVASQGASQSQATYHLGQDSLTITSSGARAGSLDSRANVQPVIFFSVPVDIPYLISGTLSVDDPGLTGKAVELTTTLTDLTTSTVIFHSAQGSLGTVDQSFVLGGTAGNQVNELSGSPTGTLLAGHRYRLFYGTSIYAATSGNPATFVGDFNLKFGDCNSSTNGWQHVALTFDGGSGTARIFTNGVKAAEQGLGNFVPKTWGDLYFGYHPAGTNAGTAFAGGLDEFGVYERALSECEIGKIFSAGHDGKHGSNVLTCPVALELGLNNVVTGLSLRFTNGLTWANSGLRWETNTINFANLLLSASTNGLATNLTSLTLRPLDPNVTVDDFVLSAILTNSVDGFLHFTEDPNFARAPIKFASAPFVATNVFPPTLIFSNDFENATPGIYTNGSIIPGNLSRHWTNMNGSITVVSNASFGAVGTNWVALAGGALQCNLPTSPGHRYELSYTVRGPCAVGWWNGEVEPLSQRARDLIGSAHGAFINGATNTAAGHVRTNALYFDGRITTNLASKIELGDPPNLRLTNALTIEAWIRPIQYSNNYSGTEQIFFRGDRRNYVGNYLDPYYLALDPHPAGGGLRRLRFHVEDANNRGQDLLNMRPIDTIDWHHVAAVFEPDVLSTDNPPQRTNQMRLYVDGTVVITNIAFRPFRELDPHFSPGVTIGNRSRTDASQPYRGYIDELSVYGRAITDPEIQAIFDAGMAGKADLVVPPAQSLAKVRVLLDGDEVDVGYGENSKWTTHKVIFTARVTNAVLELESLLPGTVVDAITLTELTPELHYLPEESIDILNGEQAFGAWKLEIWDTRVGATNDNPQLLSWQLNLKLLPSVPPPIIHLSHGIPYTNSIPGKGVQYFVVDVPQWATMASNVLEFASQFGTITPAPIAVLFSQTDFPLPADLVLIGPAINGTTVLNSISVPPLVVGQPYYLAVINDNPFAVTFALSVWFDIATLANCQPATNFVGPAGIPRYFQFDVPTNPAPEEVTLKLSGALSNLTVVLSEHLPLPDLAYHDYISQQPCTNDEVVIVLTNSTPFPIQTGRWYVGVFNLTTANVPFTVEACYANYPTLIPLTNQVPYVAAPINHQYSAPPGPPRFFFFEFEITDSLVDAVLFELYELSGNADLVLQRDVPPGMAAYFDRSFRLNTTPEQIVVRKNAEVQNLLGKWYLGVYNNEAINVAYRICASVSTGGMLMGCSPVMVSSASPSAAGTGFQIQWNSVPGERFEVEASSDLVNWSWVATITATTSTASFTDPMSLAIPTRFYRIRQVP